MGFHPLNPEPAAHEPQRQHSHARSVEVDRVLRRAVDREYDGPGRRAQAGRQGGDRGRERHRLTEGGGLSVRARTMGPFAGSFEHPQPDIFATISNAFRNAFVQAFEGKLENWKKLPPVEQEKKQ